MQLKMINNVNRTSYVLKGKKIIVILWIDQHLYKAYMNIILILFSFVTLYYFYLQCPVHYCFYYFSLQSSRCQFFSFSFHFNFSSPLSFGFLISHFNFGWHFHSHLIIFTILKRVLFYRLLIHFGGFIWLYWNIQYPWAQDKYFSFTYELVGL